MKQQQGAIEKEKDREADVGRARIAARTRFANKRRFLMRAAITSKKGETKAKAAHHVRTGQDMRKLNSPRQDKTRGGTSHKAKQDRT